MYFRALAWLFSIPKNLSENFTRENVIREHLYMRENIKQKFFVRNCQGKTLHATINLKREHFYTLKFPEP